jgi:hypothetical protein
MHGYFIISGSLTQTSNDPHCDAIAMTDANCTAATFIDTHFVPCYQATCTVSTYFDHYSAGDPGPRRPRVEERSCDRGGNHGDIADLVGPAPPPTPCI